MPPTKSGLKSGINSRFSNDLGRHFQPVGWLARTRLYELLSPLGLERGQELSSVMASK
jgi:hypothetical protein